MAKYKENIEWLIGVWKSIKPKQSDKITWVLLYSGLGLLTKSIIIQILEYYIQREFDLKFSNNDALYGLILIISALLYSTYHSKLLTQYGKEKKREMKHDKEIFRTLDSRLSEENVETILHNLQVDPCYTKENLNDIDVFIIESGKIQNKFLDLSIEDSKLKLVSSLNKLKIFLLREFTIYPCHSIDSLFHLRPDLNFALEGSGEEEDIDKYQELEDYLMDLTRDFNQKYNDFRLLVKNKLNV